MKRILVIMLLSTFLFSCGARRITTKQTETVEKETITNINPFSLSSIDTLTIDDKGVVENLRMELEYDNIFTAVATIKDNKLELNLSNLDTIRLTHIERTTENTNVQPVKIVASKMPKWIRNLLIASVVFNLITVLYLIIKLYRSIMIPKLSVRL